MDDATADGRARRLVDRLPGGVLVKRAAVAMSGSVVAQVALVCFTPILTRQYDPDDFGVLALLLSITGIGYVVAGLRYESAVPLPDDDRQGRTVLYVSAVCVVLVSIVVGAATMAARGWLAEVLQAPQLDDAMWLVGPTVLAAGLFQSLSTWSVRIGDFRMIAVSRAVQTLVTIAIQVIGGLRGGGLSTLLVAVPLGWAAGAAVLVVPLHRSRRPDEAVTIDDLWQMARRYRRFPLFASGSSLLNRTALEVPPLALSALYGPHVAGLFLLAYRSLILPTNMIVQSVYQVFVHQGARLVRTDPVAFRHLYQRTTRRLFTWTIPLVVVVVLTAPSLFALVFGAEWRESGVYTQIMAVALLALVPTGAISATFSLVERPDVELRREVARLLLFVAAFVAADVFAWSARGAVVAYTLAFISGAALLWVLSWREVRAVGPDPALVGAW